MPLAVGYNKLKSKAGQIVESVKTSKALSQKKEVPLPYAYPCDNYMDSILSNGLIRKALQMFADKYCKAQIQKIKSDGQLVCENNYPHLYDILQSCYNSLNVEEIPEVYITNHLKGINALSVGTDSAPIILISRKAVISLSDGELKFMIGHELGHILQGNLMCHIVKGALDSLNEKSEVLGPMVSEAVEVPLNYWYRCAEYTSDRAGYLCCLSLEAVKQLFMRLSGSTMNPASIYDVFKELNHAHPLYGNRLNELKAFAVQL